ncbi:MAG: energy-coupling factor ABC transporter substrate-binding protein [Methanotrichaceae archaeon]|nr:energy-coupling factor ABC transporter substrate-binding protein [Methanotrichaceae archaeon]
MKMELIVLAIIVVFIGAFAYVSSTGQHEWGGADDQPENVINDLTHGSYSPWFNSIWEPPSPEIESLLFALQAAFGAIIIGYFLGYYRAMAKMKAAESTKEQEGKSSAEPSR